MDPLAGTTFLELPTLGLSPLAPNVPVLGAASKEQRFQWILRQHPVGRAAMLLPTRPFIELF